MVAMQQLCRTGLAMQCDAPVFNSGVCADGGAVHATAHVDRARAKA